MSVSSAASESSTGQFAPVGITLLSSAFAGLAPLFGKLAYRAQVDPYTLVALRTLIAAAALWAFYGLFWRKYLHISRANLVGCIGMGLSNGIGSLLYYTGLARIDASLAHLLYSMYPVWVFVFLSAAGHPVGRLALLRLMLALGAIFLLTWTGTGLVDLLGVMLMIGAGACYGWHVVLGQWTLADVDSRTVTLYVLSTMAIVVGIARLVVEQPSWAPISGQGWLAIVLLALFPTALARLLVFAGLRRLGGFQTTLLGVAELVVAVLGAFLFLGERLTIQQWLGAGLFAISLVLLSRDTGLRITDTEAELWESLFPEDASPVEMTEAS
jgi:drug/metabolite transporter (DMT)-like permease